MDLVNVKLDLLAPRYVLWNRRLIVIVSLFEDSKHKITLTAMEDAKK